MQVKKQKISAEEFDRRFDDGEDILEFLELEKAVRPNSKSKKKIKFELSKNVIQENPKADKTNQRKSF